MSLPTQPSQSPFSSDPSSLAQMPLLDWSPQEPERQRFLPQQPQSLAAAELEEHDIVALVLKFLYLRGSQTGHAIAKQLKLNIAIVEPLLNDLKRRLLVVYSGSAMANDYVYQLTPAGLEQARLLAARCTYCGAAPVSLDHYHQALEQQTWKTHLPSLQEIKRAMSPLVMSDRLIGQIGQALHVGKSLLLYGDAGNGKTSIARRCLHSRSDTIWIPRTLTVSGEIIRLYDPAVHEAMPPRQSSSLAPETKIDERWVEIRRPTIIVGGELTLEHLEPTVNGTTGIIEAPVHLKSNGGCLIVDDFGRQRIRPEELLNRWIVPLETGQENLNLPSGRQIHVRFDQLLVFSTNLSPQYLCDEAFLRRIRYKIAVPDPTPEQFQQLFAAEAARVGIDLQPAALQYLMDKFYAKHHRPQRFCHAVDLVGHAKDHIDFHGKPPVLTPEIMDIAANNYFVGQ